MLSWLWHSESQNPEELREELMTSTTRRIGVNLRHEHISTPRRQKGMEDELSRRIRLMQKIPGSDPHAIFVYNDRGFKSFTSEYKQILHWDMLARKPKAGSKYLDYTRDMLKREIEKAKSAVTTSKVATQEQPCDLLNEDFGQLKDDHDHLKEDHDQLREDYQQLREDQKRLREEHERMLSGWREQPEKTDKGRGKENSDTRNMRSHDDREMRILELEDPRSIPEAERRAREASDAREHQRFENSVQSKPRGQGLEANDEARKESYHNQREPGRRLGTRHENYIQKSTRGRPNMERPPQHRERSALSPWASISKNMSLRGPSRPAATRIDSKVPTGSKRSNFQTPSSSEKLLTPQEHLREPSSHGRKSRPFSLY